MKVIPVFTRVNSETLKFWDNIEKSLSNDWSFQLTEFSETFHKSIYGQCIIADIDVNELNEILYFQRTFSLPYLFITNFHLECSQQLKILRAGALDVLTAPVCTETIKAKILHYFSSSHIINNEQMITDACLTKVEEQILRVILGKKIITTAENIYKDVWREGNVQIKTFNVHISKLRKKLKTIGLDVKCLKDKSYHVIKKRSLQEDVEKSRSI